MPTKLPLLLDKEEQQVLKVGSFELILKTKHTSDFESIEISSTLLAFPFIFVISQNHSHCSLGRHQHDEEERVELSKLKLKIEQFS